MAGSHQSFFDERAGLHGSVCNDSPVVVCRLRKGMVINMEIEKKDRFPSEDGHIESILIGTEQVKISFQTWDARKMVLIFDNVEKVISSHSVYCDIGEFKVIPNKNGFQKYIFYSSWYDENNDDVEVLSIEAEKMEIFQVGVGAEMNSALFDVGYEYIGGQPFPYYNL